MGHLLEFNTDRDLSIIKASNSRKKNTETLVSKCLEIKLKLHTLLTFLIFEKLKLNSFNYYWWESSSSSIISSHQIRSDRPRGLLWGPMSWNHNTEKRYKFRILEWNPVLGFHRKTTNCPHVIPTCCSHATKKTKQPIHHSTTKTINHNTKCFKNHP